MCSCIHFVFALVKVVSLLEVMCLRWWWHSIIGVTRRNLKSKKLLSFYPLWPDGQNFNPEYNDSRFWGMRKLYLHLQMTREAALTNTLPVQIVSSHGNMWDIQSHLRVVQPSSLAQHGSHPIHLARGQDTAHSLQYSTRSLYYSIHPMYQLTNSLC